MDAFDGHAHEWIDAALLNSRACTASVTNKLSWTKEICAPTFKKICFMRRSDEAASCWAGEREREREREREMCTICKSRLVQ